jgi:gephyrin
MEKSHKPRFQDLLVIYIYPNHSFIARSTGNQSSSRLLSLRSANALLEIPKGHGFVASGDVVPALLIADFNNFPSGTTKSSYHNAEKQVTDNVSDAQPKVKVAILTVSDTVASGQGVDRR